MSPYHRPIDPRLPFRCNWLVNGLSTRSIGRWSQFESVSAHLRTGGFLWPLKHHRNLDDVNVHVAKERTYDNWQPRTCCVCRRLLLGHAGPDPQAARRCQHTGRVHGRRCAERDLSQPWISSEAIEIECDPTRISYRDLLEFFFQIHDPTTLNRQGNDAGTSYRSEIFYVAEAQRDEALRTIDDVNASGLWPGSVVTKVSPAGEFWEAEPEHQDYLERVPNGYTCHFIRPGWKLPKRGGVAAE